MKDIGERDFLTPGDIEALVHDVFLRAGLAELSARAIARSVRCSESAGQRRLGLGLVPQMAEHLRCERVNCAAAPRLSDAGLAALLVDADGGFACPAVEAGLNGLVARALEFGIAILSIRNAYPVGSGLPFLDYCAAHGLVGIANVSGLVVRAAPNGNLVLEIEPCSLGLPQITTTMPLPVVPDRDISATAAPLFEGPVGPPFRLSHSFVAIRPNIWPFPPDASSEPAGQIQNSGIAVPPVLLEKIINA
ncbi:Ldh family oxidoreductase [Nioella aestuarii]|uniref:Ldh family oxidoreductase n=1 Tax=Nioella aestuarii TaxID=1662864 RepID=UPI003D7F4E88